MAATAVQKFPGLLWPTSHQLISHVGNIAATHVGALLCSALLCPAQSLLWDAKLAVKVKRKVFESFVTTRGVKEGREEEERKENRRETGVREALFVLDE